MYPMQTPIMMSLLGAAGPMNPQAPRQLRPQPMPPMDMGEQVPSPSYAQRIAKMQAGGGFNPLALEYMAQNQELLERMYQQEGGKATGDWIRSQAGRTPEGQQAFNQAWNDADAISGLMNAPSAESSAAVENLKRQAASRGKAKAMKNYRKSGFNPQTAVPQKYQQKYSDMLGLNQLDAGQALQGGRSASGQPLRGLTQQLQGPSDYDPAASTAHRDQMYDRWSNNQGAANGTRNVFSKFSSPAPDANGNMVDMPGIKIQSARAALAESIENNPNASESQKQTAAQIRKQQREEGLLSSAQSGVRELRRKARALGMETNHYQFLAADATPEQIRRAIDTNKDYEAVLDNARKERLRGVRQQQAEALAQQQFNQRLGSLPLPAQMRIFGMMAETQSRRDAAQAEFDRIAEQNKSKGFDTKASFAMNLIQAGVQSGDQSLIDEGRAMYQGLVGGDVPAADQTQGNTLAPAAAKRSLDNDSQRGGPMSSSLEVLGLDSSASAEQIGAALFKRQMSGSPMSQAELRSLRRFIEARMSFDPTYFDGKMTRSGVPLVGSTQPASDGALAIQSLLSSGTLDPDEVLRQRHLAEGAAKEQDETNRRMQAQQQGKSGTLFPGGYGGFDPYRRF